mgnify:CR=1 FL=1
MKRALITGITGQDGSYLAELLLGKGYEVHGLARRVAAENQQLRLSRIAEFQEDLRIHTGDLTDYARMIEVFQDVRPDEVYHLGAQSFVKDSFDDPHNVLNTNMFGTLNVLRALERVSPHSRFYFAATSEMFGKVEETPQTEKTPFHPRSPYGISKLAGFELTRNYRERESGNLFASSGILFNHESPRRGGEFVTRKITQGVSRIALGEDGVLSLGNLDAKRDWGFAGDYVEGMWRMLQQDAPDDYVLATGETHAVREFVSKAFDYAGVKMEWKGSGIEEKCVEKETGKVLVDIDPKYFRPSEVDLLLGDASKARRELGWSPKTSFDDLVEMMVRHDINILKRSLNNSILL